MSYWWNIGIVIALGATVAVAIETDFYSPREIQNYDGPYDQLDWHSLRSPQPYEEQRESDQEFERRRPLFYPIMPYHPFYPHYYPSQDSDEFETIEAVRKNNHYDQFTSEENEAVTNNNNYDPFTNEERSKVYFQYENSKLHPSLNIGNKDQDKYFFFGQQKPHFPSNTPSFQESGFSQYPYPYYLLHGNFSKKKPMRPFHQKYSYQRFPFNINQFDGDIKNKPSYYGYQKPQTFSHGNIEKSPIGPFQQAYFKQQFPLKSNYYGKGFPLGPSTKFHYRPFHYRPHFPYFNPFNKKPAFNNYESDVEDVQESKYGQVNTDGHSYFSEKGNNNMFNSMFNAEANEMKPKDMLNLLLELLGHSCHHQGHNKPHGDESSQEHLEDEVEGSGEEIIPIIGYPAHIPELKDV